MRRVLWAEDNRQDQFFIQAALEDGAAPAAVCFVDDGVLLLQELEAGAPDLVVLDLKMPRVGGLEALRRLRADPRWRDLPVVVFSAGDNPEETLACHALGVAEVVQKPVGFHLFAAAVRRIVKDTPVAEPPAGGGLTSREDSLLKAGRLEA